MTNKEMSEKLETIEKRVSQLSGITGLIAIGAMMEKAGMGELIEPLCEQILEIVFTQMQEEGISQDKLQKKLAKLIGGMDLKNVLRDE